jgi:hypothetical protein
MGVDDDKDTYRRGTGIDEPVPLPGTRQAEPEGMNTYIVELENPESADQPTEGRQAFYESRLALGKQARDRIEAWITENRFANRVAHLGNPTGLLTIPIVCDPEVATALKAMPGIRAVISDAKLTIVR